MDADWTVPDVAAVENYNEITMNGIFVRLIHRAELQKSLENLKIGNHGEVAEWPKAIAC